MTKIAALLACLLLPSLAFAHGVERGSVRQAIADFGMKEETKARVVQEVLARCQVKSASVITATAQEKIDEIDQGVTDFFYTLRIEALLPGSAQPSVILVEVAEYAISNPAVDNIELLSIESNICQ